MGLPPQVLLPPPRTSSPQWAWPSLRLQSTCLCLLQVYFVVFLPLFRNVNTKFELLIKFELNVFAVDGGLSASDYMTPASSAPVSPSSDSENSGNQQVSQSLLIPTHLSGLGLNHSASSRMQLSEDELTDN
jgi:hypothetical protein